MQTSDFHFELPDELIAQAPLAARSDSRMLTLQPPNTIAHNSVRDLPSLLKAGDLLVFNNTRVIPARMFGQKSSGGKVELLVERVLSAQEMLVKLKASKSPKPGSTLEFNQLTLSVVERQSDLFLLSASEEALAAVGATSIAEWLDEHGEMPLPPYILRTPDAADSDRYQTVFASEKGAVAAPTAGLHFDDALLTALTHHGINSTTVTLHVGAGTYQPVRAASITDHEMHAERVIVSKETVDAVQRTKASGGRVIAVGTTSVRSLETAALNTGELQPYEGDTDIFLYPGKRFNVIDGLLTNFHLPESTLLMLVSALAGTQSVLNAYRIAVEERYRFFSYGDAMLVWPKESYT